jgi:hypothetical protein
MKSDIHRWPLTSDDSQLDFRNQSPLQPLSAKLLSCAVLVAAASAVSTYFILQSQLRSFAPFSLFCSAIGAGAFVFSTVLVAFNFRRLTAARRRLPKSASQIPENWLDDDQFDGQTVDWAHTVLACRDCDQRLSATEFPLAVARIRQQWSDRAVEQFNKQLLVALLPAIAGFIAGSGQLQLIQIGSVFGSWLHFYWPLVAGAVLSLLTALLSLQLCNAWERAFEDWQQIADACLIQFAVNSQPPQPIPTVVTPAPAPAPVTAPVTFASPPNQLPPRVEPNAEPVPTAPPDAPPQTSPQINTPSSPPFSQQAASPWGKRPSIVPEPYIPEPPGSVRQES